jgi:hypothetical protein
MTKKSAALPVNMTKVIESKEESQIANRFRAGAMTALVVNGNDITCRFVLPFYYHLQFNMFFPK